ncbi:MAG: TnsA endonuclease N-terminal domain-containing protein [Burkholderiales bacterium]|nr:TnsA endonuclease N-terminal domain-containing protein [Burkholderiales bacterium]
MTIKKLTALIKAGYGQGHFQRYKPWLRVTKRDYSPNSNIGHLPAASLARAHHYRARAERTTIQLAKWLGAVDAREAFPAWPWPHRHPGDGLEGFGNAPIQPGLLAIAKDADINHGTYVGTDLPYVATIDIMTTWRLRQSGFRLLALENKPEEIAHDPDPLLRAKERLELTRRYCKQADITRVLVHAEKLPKELAVNLDLIEPTTTSPAQAAIRASQTYQALIELLSIKGYAEAPTDLMYSMASRLCIPVETLWPMFDLALWHQDIDHDLTMPFKSWTPLIPGGRAYKQVILNSWLGGGQ